MRWWRASKSIEVAAVQSERDRSDNNATVDVDEESEETPATSATDVDVELINAGTQTDESSLSQPSDCVESCIKHETRFLPSPNSELIKCVDIIVYHFSDVNETSRE